jgi:hypothetical protein
VNVPVTFVACKESEKERARKRWSSDRMLRERKQERERARERESREMGQSRSDAEREREADRRSERASIL